MNSSTGFQVYAEGGSVVIYVAETAEGPGCHLYLHPDQIQYFSKWLAEARDEARSDLKAIRVLNDNDDVIR